ncbi:MAG: cobalt ECF transporter T component CbiQ [Bacillota bacterium]
MAHQIMETYIERPSLLGQIDPRMKVIFTVLALVVSLTTGEALVHGLLIMVAVAGLALVGQGRVKMVLVTLAPPLIIAGMVFLTQLLFMGGQPLFSLKWANLGLTVYREGLDRGLLLGGRILASTGLVLLLTRSTGVEDVLSATRWLGLPRSLAEVIVIANRYIALFTEEFERVKKAQAVRLGYMNWKLSFHSISVLGGLLIIRAFDRGEMLASSMRCRGYNGNLPLPGFPTKRSVICSGDVLFPDHAFSVRVQRIGGGNIESSGS